MLTRKELRAAARNELSGFWTMPVLATLVYFLITSVCGVPRALNAALPHSSAAFAFSGASLFLTLFVLIPLAYGFTLCFLQFIRGSKEDTVERMFDGFKTFGRALGIQFLTAIFILLWTVLLIVPGIIKSFSYAMTIYISKDHPELDANECIERSMDMMNGHKWDLFMLYLSFIGWFILCLFTMGIGFLWLIPYIQVSVAEFYEDLKAQEEAEMGAMID